MTPKFDYNLLSGTLTVVATPIGNLEDLSLRAKEALQAADLIACEDTRHTRKLCSHYEITTPLISYYREIELKKSEHLLRQLKDGKNIALVSDAGTPGLSDPGATLVGKARAAGISIVAIPGPSALCTALSIAGIKQNHFYFGGYPPAKRSARKILFRSLVSLPAPLVFFEAPHRITEMLYDLQKTLGDRPALLFRELTKIHEECLEGTISSLITRTAEGIKGELILFVLWPDKLNEQPEQIDDLIRWYRDTLQTSLKEAVRRIANDLELPRTHVYKRALTLWEEHHD